MENDFCIEGISKRYGKKLVLDGVQLAVPRGSIVGILGLNGTGKSTLFNVLAGFVNYKGTIGKNKSSDIAYMSTDNLLYNDKTVAGMLTFYKDFMPGFDYETAKADLTKLGIELKKMTYKLSMGQKRIVSFVLTIYCEAAVYLFDEPLTNLDIIYRKYLVGKLIDRIDENRVFLVSSHELLELEPVLSHVVILKDKKLGELRLADEIRDGGQSISDYYLNEVGVC